MIKLAILFALGLACMTVPAFLLAWLARALVDCLLRRKPPRRLL